MTQAAEALGAVAVVAESLQEAVDEPGGRAVYRAVYDDEVLLELRLR